MYKSKVLFVAVMLPAMAHCVVIGPQCEPMRIEMCYNIGYNMTAMPNLVGHELQSEVEFTLQTFAPLIEYVCSAQLKLFLCAAYVPMCTPKVPVPIGPCRNLCESVRSRCHPVLQGFGFPWPPALDCNRFPKENNHETMCMEGPGESHLSLAENEVYLGVPTQKVHGFALECPDHLYVKLHRSNRCVPLCEADILFGQQEKHLADIWVATWNYAALGLGLLATVFIIFAEDSKDSCKWSCMLVPLVCCHDMVVIGWTVRFISGRIATSCGYDPQLPNVSLLLVDGLSNASCAATFLLRYYFGMAANAWWAILCLGWHRDVRQGNPSVVSGVTVGKHFSNTMRHLNITHSNLARFVAWGLPAFQTAAVIVAHLVDADELLGACFVGNQSDKGLQILVATPLFCYWIVGSMNLISGYLVLLRNKEFKQTTNSGNMQHHLATKGHNSDICTFLFLYCAPSTVLLVAVIYEFANIDDWLNLSAVGGSAAPMFPFMIRSFMEIMLGIICFAWILGPKISSIYKRQVVPVKQPKCSPASRQSAQSSRASNIVYSAVSYQSVRNPPPHNTSMVMNQLSNYSIGPPSHFYVNHSKYKQQQHNRLGNETIV